MKISIYYSLLNFQNTKRFKQFFFVFTLLVFGVFSQSVSAQFVSIENDRDATEGNILPGRFIVRVASLSFSGNVTVNYDVILSSTATEGSDFGTLSRSVPITVDFFGGGSEYINVSVLDDLFVEGEETVIVKLSPSNDYNIDYKHNKLYPEKYLYLNKTNNYFENIQSKLIAQKNGYDDALILNESDKICCCSSSNIYFVKKNKIFTPPINDGALDGTVRRLLIEKKKYVQNVIRILSVCVIIKWILLRIYRIR